MTEQRLRSRFVEALGLRIHVRDGGSGAPVVLLHGLGVSSRYFVPLGERVAAGRRVLAPDLPGWGRSERPPRALGITALADVLAAFLRAEGLDRPPVVANSLGCQIVLELAVRDPGAVGPLVLIGPTVDPRYRSWERHAWRLLVDVSREPPSLWRIIARDFAVMGPRRVFAAARAALRDHPEANLPRVRAPVLVVRGARDGLVRQAWAERCAGLAPRGRLVVVEGAAHAAHYSRPGEVGRLIEVFLEEAGDRRG